MGYTHYFDQNRAFTSDEWSILTRSFNKLYKGLGQVQLDKIMGADYCQMFSQTGEQGQPVTIEPEYELGWTDFFTHPSLSPNGDDAIAFNGVGEMSHETFLLERNPEQLGFHFCKTNGKPYDLMVTSMLIVCAGSCQGALTIRSDGDEQDWEQAVRFVSGVLGKPTKLDFVETDNDDFIQVRAPTPEELEAMELETLFKETFQEKSQGKQNQPHLSIVENDNE